MYKFATRIQINHLRWVTCLIVRIWQVDAWTKNWNRKKGVYMNFDSLWARESHRSGGKVSRRSMPLLNLLLPRELCNELGSISGICFMWKRHLHMHHDILIFWRRLKGPSAISNEYMHQNSSAKACLFHTIEGSGFLNEDILRVGRGCQK